MAQTGNEKFVHEGNSWAAWIMVVVMGVGSLMVAVAVGAKTPSLAYVGGVVIVVGLVVGKVMQVAGYGIKKH